METCLYLLVAAMNTFLYIPLRTYVEIFLEYITGC